MNRYSKIGFGLTLGALSLFSAGCSRLDMQDQPKYKPQRPSEFFAGRPQRASARVWHDRARSTERRRRLL